jgi:hypothetical protein
VSSVILCYFESPFTPVSADECTSAVDFEIERIMFEYATERNITLLTGGFLVQLYGARRTGNDVVTLPISLSSALLVAVSWTGGQSPSHLLTACFPGTTI